MVYQVSESAQYNRFIPAVRDWSRQQRCEASVGHQLKVEWQRIICSECGAVWHEQEVAKEVV